MNEIEYVESIVKPLIGYPDMMSVKEKTDEMGLLLSVSVAKEDMGKIIGKEGNIAKSIRTIVNAFGMKNHKKVSIKIVEPQDSNVGERQY